MGSFQEGESPINDPWKLSPPTVGFYSSFYVASNLNAPQKIQGSIVERYIVAAKSHIHQSKEYETPNRSVLR